MVAAEIRGGEMIIIDREILCDFYITQNKSMATIAKELNVSVGKIFNSLKKFNIPSRKKYKGMPGKKHTQESKDKIGIKHKNKKVSNITKNKMSESKKGVYRKFSEYGGRTKKRADGYVGVFVPEHPNASKSGFVMEHILVVEKNIGRYLEKGMVVHHINGIRNDNRIENLKVMSFKEHAGFHMKQRHLLKRGELKSI